MKKIKIAFLLLLAISIYSCRSESEKINGKWKSMGKSEFGDFLVIENESWSLRTDTIYRDKVPFAILVGHENGSSLLGIEAKMELKSLETGKSCFFTNKGK